MHGRVNTSESLINVVRTDKPKVLPSLVYWTRRIFTKDHRLGPKGMWHGIGTSTFPVADIEATGEEARPTPCRYSHGTW